MNNSTFSKQSIDRRREPVVAAGWRLGCAAPSSSSFGHCEKHTLKKKCDRLTRPVKDLARTKETSGQIASSPAPSYRSAEYDLCFGANEETLTTAFLNVTCTLANSQRSLILLTGSVILIDVFVRSLLVVRERCAWSTFRSVYRVPA